MRNSRIGLVRCLLFVAMALSLGGCSRLGRIAPFAPDPGVTVEQIAQRLREEHKPIETLWIRARVIADKPGLPGKRHFEATILYQPPDRLRLRAYRNVSLLVFDLLADGQGIRLFNPGDKLTYAAPYERLRGSESEWAALDPQFVMRALLVRQTLLGELERAQTAGVRGHWTSYELRMTTPDSSIRVFFDSDTGRLEAIDYRPDNKALAARIAYEEMMEVDGVRLPKQVEIRHRQTRARLRLEVSEYKLNREFRPEVFAPAWLDRTQWFPLELLK